ncbi:TetR/AcrR family transcriptional regulator C-terminal domain-containing protein [Streptomyces sp. J2-1]|uniref:TetR/AcrR family transcriptional regulator C-terminal domain-containing protein n=1 Tax=Streptomyces corallincola TaxID=2851888 RepID=UPI001C3933BD|nr:TetR/AcrR family transcriptional regulator C-terminal domain-containing protein [Streptomyces corallincola]MBV2356873.1 TetR/AcrR family transcriptional regulator C-terminal domain-containing protein [Streptomyces corallincola]
MANTDARPVRTSVWLEGRTRRAARGGQPSGLDRERITAASVRLLDAGGLAGFSMRRLAADLNVTAMSLYWYVDTKDHLLELALDAAYGELPDPAAEEGADWRGRLRRLAGEYRAMLLRHPWLSPLAGRYLNIGPHALAFSRGVRRAVRDTGLPADRVPGAIAAVLQFVYGYGTLEGRFLTRSADSGQTPDEYVEQALASARQDPRVAAHLQESREIIEARGSATVAENRDRDFTVALDLLLAGIEAMADRG